MKKQAFLQQIGQLLVDPTPMFTCFKTGHEQPTPIFEDNKGTHDMFKSGRVTTKLKHLDIPLEFMHEIHSRGSLQCKPCSTHVQWGDPFTKQTSGPVHLQYRTWYTGKRFHPPVGTAHYKALTEQVPLP